MSKAVRVDSARKVRPQYFVATLDCGHVQVVHSVRPDGPLFVVRCQTCTPGKARPARKGTA